MQKADAMIEALLSKFSVNLLETCAYAGSGNVLHFSYLQMAAALRSLLHVL